jgi:hypothetical protein
VSIASIFCRAFSSGVIQEAWASRERDGVFSEGDPNHVGMGLLREQRLVDTTKSNLHYLLRPRRRRQFTPGQVRAK